MPTIKIVQAKDEVDDDGSSEDETQLGVVWVDLRKAQAEAEERRRKAEADGKARVNRRAALAEAERLQREAERLMDFDYCAVCPHDTQHDNCIV